jgi:hypothetical protein
MPKCPNPECGHDNVDGTQFCEMCGEELENPDSGGTSVAAGDTIFCPECDAANDAGNVACEACGADLPGQNLSAPQEEEPVSTEPDIPAIDPAQEEELTHASTAAAPDSASAPDAEPGPKLEPGQVKLSVEQGMVTGKQYVLADNEMLVGREDEDEEIYPDIDLDDQDEGFVHRRHATLKFDNGQLTVTHEGGANKTRINNRPIPDNQAMPLKLGDKVSFGKVVLRVLPNV